MLRFVLLTILVSVQLLPEQNLSSQMDSVQLRPPAQRRDWDTEPFLVPELYPDGQ